MSFFKRKTGKIHPVYHKELTSGSPIEDGTTPQLLHYYLSTHIGKPAEPVVKVGDKVKVGTVIAEASAEISSHAHSSVSGEVISIEEKEYLGENSTCVVVRNDYRYDSELPLFDTPTRPDADKIRQIIRDAGIVGMGGAMFPTDIKIASGEENNIKRFIVNGAECEPYSTSDYRLMIEYAAEISKGIEIIHSLLSIQKTFIAIEDDMQPCIRAMKKAANHIAALEVVALPAAYPQGSEHVLVKQLLGEEVPSGKQPPAIGVLVMNVSTIFAVYEAVTLGKPLTQRVVTVSGTQLKNPKNLRVRLGTPIDSLIKDCGGFSLPPLKVLHGGPMMGKTVTSGDISVSGGTAVITLLFEDDVPNASPKACIRCAKCLEVCPINLQPILIHNAYEHGKFEDAKLLGAQDCVQCGNCTYICPSDIPLLESIRVSVSEIKEKEL